MKHLLLVEDDPIIARLTRALVGRAGWDTDWVETGRRAIETLSERRYPLVLLDLGLPDVDGKGVVLWLRHFEADRGHARTPVVVLSATDSPRVTTLDVDTVLQKPLRMAALEEILLRLEVTS